VDRIDRLLMALTLEEKIGQLNMVAAGSAVTGPVLARDVTEGIRAGRIGNLLNLWGTEPAHAVQRLAVEETRNKIPLLLGFDVIHGHRTIFPIPLAEAASFDPHLWERTSQEAATEAACDGISMTFAPMLDVARDPRWGRIGEGPGEDPWIAERFAEAKVCGFQGANLSAAGNIAATAKHFCAYGAATAGRDYASVDISERILHEVYLPPFKAAVVAGCAAVMPAFNDLAGIPMTAHVPLLRDWLRVQHDFQGVIISDYNAITELIRHGIAADIANAAALALRAGVDIDMMGDAYSRGLPGALKRGLVDMDQIDTAVRRVLNLKERLGLFDDPYRRGSAAASDRSNLRQLAREAARRAIVLLTNDHILPLRADARRIAVIGPLASARADMRGPWSAAGDAADPITILEGLKAALPNCEINYASGVGIVDEDTSGIAAALDVCRAADVVLMSVGEEAKMSGEAASRANPGLPGRQRELAEAVFAIGKPVVVLLSSGRPLMVTWLVEQARALVATWFLGSEAGNAIADVLTGRFNPTGRLPVTWPRDIGQVPIFYAERPSGRPANPEDDYTSKYLDMPVEPLFPFGHGLSYSRFNLSNLRTSIKDFKLSDQIRVEVDVINEGAVSGEETVFLFARDVVASVARPLLELKGVAKIALGPGESGTVSLKLHAKALRFRGLDLRLVLEPGDFQLSVGPSADPERLLTTTVRAVSG
jgi:beta-glucosidase